MTFTAGHSPGVLPAPKVCSKLACQISKTVKGFTLDLCDAAYGDCSDRMRAFTWRDPT
jgi:hypothetical protein